MLRLRLQREAICIRIGPGGLGGATLWFLQFQVQAKPVSCLLLAALHAYPEISPCFPDNIFSTVLVF